MDFGKGFAVLFGVSATLVYDTISATNSSPQTTEINASVRADTLMKWVYLGLGQAALLVAIMALVAKMEGQSPAAPVLGGGLAGALLYAQYIHARDSGLRNGGAGTETLGGFG